MKKTIAILLILVIGMVGVFADPAQGTGSTVQISTEVIAFTYIGLTDKSTPALVDGAFKTEANFLNAVKDSVKYTTSDFETLATFENNTPIAYVWGITNTLDADITVTISTPGFIGGDDSVIPLKLNGADDSTTLIIPKATKNALGVLKTNNVLNIKEKTVGTIALAPAQEYEATITISITTDGSGGEGGSGGDGGDGSEG